MYKSFEILEEHIALTRLLLPSNYFQCEYLSSNDKLTQTFYLFIYQLEFHAPLT